MCFLIVFLRMAQTIFIFEWTFGPIKVSFWQNHFLKKNLLCVIFMTSNKMLPGRHFSFFQILKSLLDLKLRSYKIIVTCLVCLLVSLWQKLCCKDFSDFLDTVREHNKINSQFLHLKVCYNFTPLSPSGSLCVTLRWEIVSNDVSDIVYRLRQQSTSPIIWVRRGNKGSMKLRLLYLYKMFV